MTYNIENLDGDTALDYNALTKLLDGYGVVLGDGGGCEVTAASGMDLNIASGTVLLDGSSTSIASTTVTVSAANSDYPRKDVVYVDSAGSIEIAEGIPGRARPTGETGARTYHPEPPDLSATEAVLLAEVWVAAGTSEITSGDIRDRRVSSDAAFASAEVDNVWLGKQAEAPTDTEIGSGNVAFYAKDDENLYKKPYGGSESKVGGGIFEDTDGDGLYEQTTGDGISVGALWDESDILLIGTSGQLIERRDPANSTTPVTDAITDLETAGGGEIHLPTGTIDDDGPVPFGDFVKVRGRTHGGSNATVLNITGGGRGLELPGGNKAREGAMEGFRVTNGSGLGNATGAGCYIGGTLRQFDVDLRFDDWTQPFVSDSSSYENNFRRLFFAGCDAGAGNGIIDIQSIGPANEIGLIAASPTDTDSAADSKILYIENTAPSVELTIGTMNIGGTASWAIDRRALSYLEVGQINWEPAGANSVPDRVIYQGNDEAGKYHFLRVNGEADNAYFLNGGGSYLGKVRVTGTLNNDIVRVNTDITESTVYEGKSGDVNNASGGTLTESVSCLGDLTTVN